MTERQNLIDRLTTELVKLHRRRNDWRANIQATNVNSSKSSAKVLICAALRKIIPPRVLFGEVFLASFARSS